MFATRYRQRIPRYFSSIAAVREIYPNIVVRRNRNRKLNKIIYYPDPEGCRVKKRLRSPAKRKLQNKFRKELLKLVDDLKESEVKELLKNRAKLKVTQTKKEEPKKSDVFFPPTDPANLFSYASPFDSPAFMKRMSLKLFSYPPAYVDIKRATKRMKSM